MWRERAQRGASRFRAGRSGGIGGVGAPGDQTGAQQLNLGILNGVFKNVQTGAYIQALKQVYKYVDSVGLVIGVVALPEAI